MAHTYKKLKQYDVSSKQILLSNIFEVEFNSKELNQY